MLNILLEKCADWLLPVLGGCLVWYGAHYFVLTPRIINVDVKNANIYDNSLPPAVNACLRSHLADQLINDGLMEAAIYTATIKNVAEPFQKAISRAQATLDEVCGVSHARRIQRENQRLAEQEAAERQRLKDQISFWRKLLTGR
ncbi:MAG: hypothetical protein CL561_12410 [Alphaproteobacteria bacterium]|nr:hypothetical protein [Alphaproteobacteria bacterium]|tara:strand:- start:1174 stop:1605 length:432 start_codon:yes stop_codon:yes gene_type:complete